MQKFSHVRGPILECLPFQSTCMSIVTFPIAWIIYVLRFQAPVLIKASANKHNLSKCGLKMANSVLGHSMLEDKGIADEAEVQKEYVYKAVQSHLGQPLKLNFKVALYSDLYTTH